MVKKMKKIYFIGIVFLVFISLFCFAQGSPYETEFIKESKYTIRGTVCDDYNQCKFTMDKGISGSYNILVETIEPHNFSIGFKICFER